MKQRNYDASVWTKLDVVQHKNDSGKHLSFCKNENKFKEFSKRYN